MNTFFGSAALVGFIAAAWQKLKMIGSRLVSLVIVKATLQDNAMASAIQAYCWNNFRKSRFGNRAYDAMSAFVRPCKRYRVVAYEKAGTEPILFWFKRRPVLISRSPGNSDSPPGISLTFLRGSFDTDAFIIAALEQYNERQTSGKQRFGVHHCTGNGSVTADGRGSPGSPTKGRPSDAAQSSTSDEEGALRSGAVRVLKWKPEEIGIERAEGSALGALAFPAEIYVLADEVRRWLASEEWYRGKQIPWRRGWLLYGAPGTGKTSLARAVAQDFDLPIFVYDLASMSNHDMIYTWREMLSNAPCMVLIEDIDAVFSGRDNRLGDNGGGLSFDCLLNCISGIEAANGIFLVITTNRIAELDSALGIPRADKESNGTLISSRPGRIDRALELTGLDEQCRIKIARRILADCAGQIDLLVAQGAGDTGAQFQERCAQVALKHHWATALTRL